MDDATPDLAHANAGGFMQRSIRSLDGIIARAMQSSRCALLRGLALGALALGCTEPSAPVATLESRPKEIIIIGGRQVVVFNAVLGAIGDPDENQGALGHLQLQLSVGEDAGFVIEWRLMFTDDASWPYCASENSGAGSLGGGIYVVTDPENLPSPEVRPTVDLLDGREVSCQGNVLVGSTEIPEELAARMIQDPENFVGVFFNDPEERIAGTLQLGGPDTAPGP
jgi:hypothetical protein